AAMTALIAGQVDMLVDSLPPSLPHIRAGRVRALAVTSATRAPQLPDVPTMAEAGFPGFEVSAWSGVVAAAATPSAIVARLESAFRRGGGIGEDRERDRATRDRVRRPGRRGAEGAPVRAARRRPGARGDRGARRRVAPREPRQ